MTGALRFAEKTGYPVLVRPSYVLSGAAMNVAYTAEKLADYLREVSRSEGKKEREREKDLTFLPLHMDYLKPTIL